MKSHNKDYAAYYPAGKGSFNVSKIKRAQGIPPLLLRYFSDFEQVFTKWL